MTRSTTFTNHGAAALLAAVAMSGLGCGVPAAPDPGGVPAAPDTSSVTAPPASTSLSGKLAGYQHTFSLSRFKPGASLSSLSEMGYAKIIGAEGTFAIDEINGSVLALPNADSRASKRPPFAGRGADHDAQVKAYFLAGGIPADQIASVQCHAMMQGSMSATGTRNPDTLVGYYSVISRAIGGVPVAESYAWARFNADGDVVDEAVHWPELPASAASGARDLVAATQEPARAQTMLRAIESSHPGFGNAAGRVVIHHNLSTDHDPLWTIATYDSSANAGKTTLHFDLTGNRLTLAHEIERGTRTPK